MSRLLLILVLLLLSSSVVFAQGSSIGTATALSLNGTAGAGISDVQRDHYWKATLTTNGYLRIEVNSGSSAIDMDANLYDTNGSTSMLFDGRSGSYSELFAFLRPGTYYIKCNLWTGTSGSYSIITSFSSPARPSETEPNDSVSTALVLGPTATATGQIGFTGGGGAADINDFWKISTTQDGWLRVQIRSDSLDLRGDQSLDLDATLYDVGGSTTIEFDGRYTTFSQVDAFLRPGTYIVKVNRWQGRGGSYEIKSDFFPPPLANDGEGNDSYQTATTAVVNGSVTGHLGYYSSGTTDLNDYWKYTITSNGTVLVQVTSDSVDQSGVALDLDLTLYDANGTTSILFDGRYGKYSEGIVYLRPGTFFVKVNRWQGNGGSYTLKITHTPPLRANDGEGNDTYSSASQLTFGTASTGHLGYYASGTTDRDDFWKIVAPSSDSIYVHVSSDTTIDVDLTAYAPDGVTSIGFDGRSGSYSRLGIKPTSGLTYYFKLNRWTGTAGSYSVIAQRSSSPTAVEEAASRQLVPQELSLDQNYPNPFNPSTSIRYALAKESRVRIAVYSILGQEIAVVQDGLQFAAYHTVIWDGKNNQGIEVPSGIYIIRLQTNDQQLVRKAVLLR